MAVDRQQNTPPTRRKASKDVRRRQLIESTIDSIAKRGYAATTMADVADGAGLSRGIVNFHFESKEKLLADTLAFMAEEYRSHWDQALESSGPEPADKLWAIVAADFDRKVCNRRYIAAWTGLRAEAQSRPAYRSICGHHDDAFESILKSLCTALENDGGYGRDSEKLAEGLDGMFEGLWLQLMLNPETMTRDSAHACAIETLTALFPAHFTRDGPIGADAKN